MSSNVEIKLNRRERFKAQMRPYNYLQELHTLDFESLGEGDRYYLQDCGIFNAEFAEEEFTLRIRVPGGRLTSQQVLFLTTLLKEYDLDMIITARAGLQIFGLESDNVFEIWQKVNNSGLSTWQSFGDNVRNIVCDVYDGYGVHHHIEVYPLIIQMQEQVLKVPHYVGMLPRRLSVGISGSSANVTSMFANDLYFALAQKDTTYGFNVYMGGKNSEVAQDADIFLLPNEVNNFFAAFLKAFYSYGSRGSRSKTRLFYLLESIGLGAFKSHILEFFPSNFHARGTLLLKQTQFKATETLQDGSFAFCYESDFGRISATEFENIASFAIKNSAEIRLGIDQNIYLLGLPEVNSTLISPKQSQTILACAGSEYCPFSFWNIKDETHYLPLEKIKRHQIQIGFSGCAKGCGRHRHTDIGLIGLKTNNFGATEGGARVFIGAQHSEGISVARPLFEMVPLEHLHQVISLIISLFEQSDIGHFETYSKEVLNQFSEGFLSLWYLANIQTSQSLALPIEAISATSKHTFDVEKGLIEHYFKDEAFSYEIDESFSVVVSQISKSLWTIQGKDPHYKPPINRTVARGSY